jgi:ATP-binding cassette subfamily B multidrug efflux pump
MHNQGKTSFGKPIEGQRLTLWGLLKPYRRRLVIGFLLLLISNLIFIVLPRLVNGGVGLIEKTQPAVVSMGSLAVPMPNIFILIMTIIGLALFGMVVRTFSRMVIFNIGRTVEGDVRAQLFSQISVMDDAFFVKNNVGDLMNHLTTDVANVRMVAGFVIINVLNIGLMFIFTVPILFGIDFWLALCALLPFPLVILATAGIIRKMFVHTQNYQASLSNLTAHVQENLLGAHVTRLFHRQDEEARRFATTNQKTFDAAMQLGRVRMMMMPVLRLTLGVSVGLVLLAGGYALTSGRISLGDFVEVNARILQLTWPAMSVGFVLSVQSRARASLARINELLAYAPLIIDGPASLEKVSLVNVVGLKYRHEKNLSLQNISFSARLGEMIAVVGASGSHKSTLLKALQRRLPVASGMIFLDHHDINDLTLASLNRQISFVSQEPFIFHKTIKENIALMRPEATHAEIEHVVNLVGLNTDVSTFPQGLDTMVGERGITLSGGQRQRLAIARALIANRPILILDDAMSAVDAKTESHIIETLKGMRREKIIIIATHRLSAIKDADRILVLEKGELMESGTHEELINQPSLYQQLWGYFEIKGRLS